ncbi:MULTISPECIES: hypothetical protein [unclassified Frankia]|uniref:hypothetical protein n=1 Tax=unclassified Frankia TaxID=2632575 RepID=UPI002024FAD1
MWTAHGEIYGLKDQVLPWDDGPLDWPPEVLTQFLDAGRRFLPAAPMRDLAELAADWQNSARPALPGG